MSVSWIDPNSVFSYASAAAMLAWLALAVSSYRSAWAPAVRLAAGRIVPLGFSVLYVALFGLNGMGDGGFDSIEAVQKLMAVPGVLVAGWLHYLAFDLFVGAWIAERGGALGMPHLVLLPIFGLTFMFGPAGLLAFALLRALWRRRQSTAPA